MVDVTTYQCAIQDQVPIASQVVKGMYLEGALNGSVNSAVETGGLFYSTNTTGAMSSDGYGTFAPVTVNTITSLNWLAPYVSDPQDVPQAHGNGRFYLAACPDFTWGSSTPCAGNAAIQQGQYEIFFGIATQDKIYFDERNLTSGGFTSTAPSNSNWPSGSIIQQVPQSNHGALLLQANHINSVVGPGGGYTYTCSITDSTNACGDIKAGVIQSGIFGMSGYAGPNLVTTQNGAINLVDNETFSGGAAVVGVGIVKMLSDLTLYSSATGIGDQKGSDGSVLSASTYANHAGMGVYPILYSSGAIPELFMADANGTVVNKTNSATLSNASLSVNTTTVDPYLGQNPNMSAAIGHEIGNSGCNYDMPPGTTQPATSISSTTTVVTVTMPNTYIANEWVKFGTISGVTGSANFTSTLGASMNGSSFQVLSAGLSTSQFEVTFANAGYGATADTGTTTPHASFRQCFDAGPVNAVIGMGVEYDTWNGTTWVLGISINPLSTLLGVKLSIAAASTGNLLGAMSFNNIWTGGTSAAINFPNGGGSASLPQATFGATNNGFYAFSTSSLGLSLSGNLHWIFNNLTPTALVRGANVGDRGRARTRRQQQLIVAFTVSEQQKRPSAMARLQQTKQASGTQGYSTRQRASRSGRQRQLQAITCEATAQIMLMAQFRQATCRRLA